MKEENLNGYDEDAEYRKWLKEFLYDFLVDLQDIRDDETIEDFINEWMEEYEI
jgi:hypothetical protein